MFQQRILVPSGVSENALERTLAIMSYGSGAARDPAPAFAELVCEVVATPAGWQLGAPRRFAAGAPFAEPSGRPIGWWLSAESVHARLRRAQCT